MQAIIERSNKQGSADVEALRDHLTNAEESKKKVEDKYLTLSNNFEHLKQRFLMKSNSKNIHFTKKYFIYSVRQP